MKAGRGYIIRFFDEKNNTAVFYAKEATSSYGRSSPWKPKLEDATIFTDHNRATNALVAVKKSTKKVKGYLYISKCFYKEARGVSWNNKGTRLSATKLTKPDRHDFLQAI